MTRGLVSIVVTALIFSGCGGQAAAPLSPTARQAALTVMDTTPPPGVSVPSAHWIKIRGAGGVAKSEQVAAVLRPPGPGPFPLVINLHGVGGLTDLDVERAARLAAAGFVAVAGCWQFATAPPNPVQFYDLKVTAIECRRMLASDADAIAALIAVGLTQPDVRTNAIGLFGLSAGGTAALTALAVRRDVRAAVLDAPAVVGAPQASRINAPVLVLAGTADVGYTNQKNYVEALQQAGKEVEWHYYEGGRHVLTLDPATRDDATGRMIDFLTRRLMAGT